MYTNQLAGCVLFYSTVVASELA